MPQTKQIKRNLRYTFVDKKTAEEDNAKINVFWNIPCNFSLFKGNAFLKIFFLRKLKI